MGRHPNNKVWEYFENIPNKKVRCRKCKAELSEPKGSRGNMVRHLYKIHGINTYLTGQKRGKALKHIPSKRGKELDECLRETEQSLLRDVKEEVSMESNSQDIEYTESNVTDVDDDSQYDYHDVSNNGIHYDNIQILNEKESLTLKIPVVKVNIAPQELHKQNKEPDGNDVNNQDDSEEVNVCPSDPLINCNVESLEPHAASDTSGIDNHHPRPQFPSLHHLTQQGVSTSRTQISIEKLKSEALTEKLKAEARYFNKLADLTESKRIFLDLQCQKLRNEIKNQNFN